MINLNQMVLECKGNENKLLISVKKANKSKFHKTKNADRMDTVFPHHHHHYPSKHTYTSTPGWRGLEANKPQNEHHSAGLYNCILRVIMDVLVSVLGNK